MTRNDIFDQIKKKESYLCIGLDTDISKIPKHLLKYEDPVFEFNRQIIDATHEYCVAYKPNLAFYESRGPEGLESLKKTVDYIPGDIFKIADAKRGDIGNTSKMYAKTFFEFYGFDAVTVAPYMGSDSVKPFFEYKNKWVILLALTSNDGAKDFQYVEKDESLRQFIRNELRSHLNYVKGFDEFIESKSRENIESEEDLRQFIRKELRSRFNYIKDFEGFVNTELKKPTSIFYEDVIKKAMNWGSIDNLMFVVGATRADMMSNIRKLIPDHFLLVPGIGAQGGSLEEVSKHGMNKQCGLFVNSSRQIIYAGNDEQFAFAAAKEAQKVQKEMAGFLDK